MNKTIQKQFFVFEINPSELVALNVSTKKRALVIGSQCVNKKS